MKPIYLIAPGAGALVAGLIWAADRNPEMRDAFFGRLFVSRFYREPLAAVKIQKIVIFDIHGPLLPLADVAGIFGDLLVAAFVSARNRLRNRAHVRHIQHGMADKCADHTASD